MMKFFRKKIALFLLACMPFSMTSCDDDSVDTVRKVVEFIKELLSQLGWNFDSEDYNNVPDDGGPVYDDTDVTKSELSWEQYFPPIGDQGKYGTCVTWSTGYALKTALNKMDNPSLNVGLTTNQTSPVDLWHLIPSSGKSTQCEGSNFDPAFNVMINKGVASMSQKPFANETMTCDGVTGTGNSSNKLGSYRLIAYTEQLTGKTAYGMTVANFKGHLQNGPIAIGARLGDNFMQCKNSSVLTSDTYGYTGQHAYHAMVLVGYDDERQAFRVRNSWGTQWGDNGSIWIGYNFFIKSFCFGAWVASNDADVASDELRSSQNSSGTDLEIKVYKDYEGENGKRIVEYDIFNNGEQTVSPKSEWSNIYMLFRKNRLSEKYLLFHDFYGTGCSKNTIGAYTNGLSYNGEGNSQTNITIQPGASAASTMNGSRLQFEYSLPLDKYGEKLNGEFYLVMIADAFGDVSENDKMNNMSFITANGAPVKIVDGKIVNMPQSISGLKTLKTETDANNYSGAEVQKVLVKQMEKGILRNLVSDSGLKRNIVAKSVIK